MPFRYAKPRISCYEQVESHSGTLALKTEDFGPKIGRFSKAQKDLLKRSSPCFFQGFLSRGWFSKSNFAFTKTSDFLN